MLAKWFRPLFAAALLLPATAVSFEPALAQAENYPTRPIRLVVAWPPGGVTDVLTRIVADKLGPELKTSVVVENRAGAAGFIGTEYVAKAKPDGYTLIVYTSSTHALSPQMFTNVPYDALKDFTPISQLTSAPTILVTQKNNPFKSVKELVDLAKSKPGELNYAHFGRGTSSHLAAELFQLMTGAKLTPVVYKGSGPILTDMLGDTVKLHMFFDSIPASLPYVKDGRLKALGVTSKEESSAAPGIPTLASTYPGFEFGVWQGIGAPSGTPKPIIDKIYAGLVAVMKMPDVRKRFIELGAEPHSSSPAEFDAFVKSENERWKGLLKQMGIERQAL